MRKLLTLLLNGTLLLSAPAAFSATNPSVVELQTNLGTIAIQLDYDHAPITANNFITYVNNGFYKDTVFHRMIKGFMMQGGGVNKADGQFKTPIANPIANEANNGLSNVVGTIAMARTDDPNSATSQFFINFVDNKFLDYSASSAGYAVFGKVIAGMSVVKAVENLSTPTITYRAAKKVGNLIGLSCSDGTTTCSTFPDLPFTSASNLITIDAVYSSDVWQPTLSKTRIMINGSGSVVSLPAGIDCGTSCELSQTKGAKLKIVATPATGYVFSGWQGDCKGANQTIAINTKQGNHNCLATFTQTTP